MNGKWLYVDRERYLNILMYEDKRVKDLHMRIIGMMKQIRHEMPMDKVNITESKGHEVWNGCLGGKPIKRVIIYLRSSGCSWAIGTFNQTTHINAGCIDCVHCLSGTTFGAAIPSGAYIEQFMKEYESFNFLDYQVLCLYNEGNFFNEIELPREARLAILNKIAATPEIKGVILESLPKYITDDVLAETKDILGERHVEIGIGLESSNPLIRKVCINKPYSLEEFKAAAERVNNYFNTLAYVLIKPSFLTEKEALEDAISTVDFAFKNGAKIISLEPVSISKYSMAGTLWQLGLYRPVMLWTVLEIVKSMHKQGEIRIGGMQFAPRYEHFAHNCSNCTAYINQIIEQYNETYDIRLFEHLDCACKKEWKTELAKEYPSLLDRIEDELAKISDNFVTIFDKQLTT
jgi:radical SAM enzyme (TIGR01210 family)